MRDLLTRAQRKRAMQSVKLKNGSIERIVQRELRTRGLKFRKHIRSLPGSPDLVFENQRVAVFVDGDFWHGWRLPAWERKLTPFWRNKLRENRKRDARNFRKLRAQGWNVIRIWQHQILNDKGSTIERILNALRMK